MRNLFYLLLSLFLNCCLNDVSAQTNLSTNKIFPGRQWKTIEPENVGYSSEKLHQAKSKFEEIGGVAALVVVNGYIIADWGLTDFNFDCRSIRKSFISSLYGIYMDKGLIDYNRTLAEIGINDGGKLNKEELKARIRHLMTSSSGIYLPAAFEEASNRNKPDRGTHRPGEYFKYNNWDFNTLSTIFNKLTDRDLFNAFDHYIAKPIGMEHFNSNYNTGYLYQPGLSEHPAYIFRISAKDLARFGLLYLNRGNWDGYQIVPEDWINESTRTQIETGDDFYYNYGYLWWVSKRKSVSGSTPFLARGAQSQFMFIDQANDLIIIFRDNPDATEKVSKAKAYPLIGAVYGAKIN